MKPRKILLLGEQQRQTALTAIAALPVGAGLEVVIRDEVKVRKLSQNDAYRAGILRDIADQAWIGDRQWDEETLHEYFKRKYLPELDDPDLEKLVRDPETYRKWVDLPNDERSCIGSTTELTIAGMARYMMQVEAFGSELGVQFRARPLEA